MKASLNYSKNSLADNLIMEATKRNPKNQNGIKGTTTKICRTSEAEIHKRPDYVVFIYVFASICFLLLLLLKNCIFNHKMYRMNFR